MSEILRNISGYTQKSNPEGWPMLYKNQPEYQPPEYDPIERKGEEGTVSMNVPTAEELANPPEEMSEHAQNAQKQHSHDLLQNKDGLSLADLGMPEYSYIDETGGRESWRNADLSPLPGEERLHEDVRKWADTDRSAGGTGMQRLRAQYLKEVPAKSRKLLGFNQWLESEQHRVVMNENGEPTSEKLDVPTFDPENDFGYRGNKAALNKKAPMPTTEHEDPDQAHRAGLRKEKVISSYLQRYGAESVLGGGGLSREEAELVYDDAALSAAQNGENPVIAAGRALKGATNGMQSSKDAQLRMNVDNRTSQNNRAQRFGVPVGVIATLDQFGDASTPEEAQDALMMGAMQYPYLGATMQGDGVQGPGVFQSLYNQMLAGEISIAQAQADLAKATGKNPLPDDVNGQTNRQAMEEEGRDAGLVDGYSKWNSSQDWTERPDDEKRLEAGAAFGTDLAVVRGKISAGEPITPEESAIVRGLLGPNPDRQAFEQLFGGGISDEEYGVLKEQITGTGDRSWSEWMSSFSYAHPSGG